ncbi:hypothetical protein SELR_20590 [Selenomonas ruminantium subsp. lactilytica TAM6421]|uniref:Uncharacterized protein n=2 Tax=Selenomonas ruminantium TaxID=971 RepID=I0GSN0_SELRL|nr:hypothetical protein SELR_20590 [Selenomonas ruminantium subsp. lactilytica TAM6421]
MEASMNVGIRPIDRPQAPGAAEGIGRRGDGGGSSAAFSPKTNVAIQTAVDDMAGILAKISSNQAEAVEKMPADLQKLIQNVMKQAFSLEETLAQGLGSTLESQRFSMEQLSSFSRMLTQMGKLIDRGMSMDVSETMQVLLTNLKSIASTEQGPALEPVLLTKAAFELLDNKPFTELPKEVQQLLLTLQPQGMTQALSAGESNSMGFLKQLVQYFMPRPSTGSEAMGIQGQPQQSNGQPAMPQQAVQGQPQPVNGQPVMQQQMLQGQPQSANGQPAMQQQMVQGQPQSANGQPAMQQQMVQGQPQSANGQPAMQQQMVQGQPQSANGQPAMQQQMVQGQPQSANGQPAMQQQMVQGQPQSANGQPAMQQQMVQGQPQPVNGQPAMQQQMLQGQPQPVNGQPVMPQQMVQGQPQPVNGQPVMQQQQVMQGQPQPVNGQPVMPQQMVQGQPQPVNGQPVMQQQMVQGQPQPANGQPAMQQQAVQGQPQPANGQPVMQQQAVQGQPQPVNGQPVMPQQMVQGQPQPVNGQPVMQQQQVMQGQPQPVNGQPVMPQQMVQGQPQPVNGQPVMPQQMVQGQPQPANGQPAMSQQMLQGQPQPANGQPAMQQQAVQGQPQPVNGQPVMQQQVMQGQPQPVNGQPVMQQQQVMQGQPQPVNGQPVMQQQTVQGQPQPVNGQPAMQQQMVQGQPLISTGQMMGQPVLTGQNSAGQSMGTNNMQSPQYIQQDMDSEVLSTNDQVQRPQRAAMQQARDQLINQTMENTPQTMNALRDLAQMLLKDGNLTQKDALLMQSFINGKEALMNAKEAQQLQQLIRLCQANVPATIQQAALQQNIPDLPRLWAFMQLCDMAYTRQMTARQLKRAGKDVAAFVLSMRNSMTGDNSVVPGQRSLNFMMPMYMGEESTYPAYIHVYDENKQDPETGEMKKETWLRLCVLTDNIGAVELTCRVYQENQLDIRLFFSSTETANEFRAEADALRDSLKDGKLRLKELKIGAVGERRFM